MAINRNHEFEDLNGIKCSVVERNASKERVDFLKSLLEYNGYNVIVVSSPPAKAALPPKPADPSAQTIAEVGQPPADTPPPTPELFIIGVTDVMFNPTNAVFGRLLRTRGGHVVTLAYWEQKENESHDEVPYFEDTT
jgi:hypothetical protein